MDLNAIVREKAQSGNFIFKSSSNGGGLNLLSPARVSKSPLMEVTDHSPYTFNAVSFFNGENVDPNPVTSPFTSPKRKLKPSEDNDLSSPKRKKQEEDLQNTIRQLQSELAKERERREELQKKNHDLEKQIRYSEQELENLGHGKEQLKEQMKEQQALKQSLLSELASVTKQNIELEEEKIARTKEILAKDEKIQQLQTELNKYLLENTQHTQKLEQLDTALQEYVVELRLKTQEHANLEKMCETLKSQSQQTTDQLSETAQIKDKLEKEKNMFQSTVNQMESSICKLKENCALALKLNGHSRGLVFNFDTNILYEQVHKEKVPFEEWHTWLVSKTSPLPKAQQPAKNH